MQKRTWRTKTHVATINISRALAKKISIPVNSAIDMMEEEDFVKGEDILNASDEEDDHVLTDKKHAKLLDSISALDGQRRSKLSERTVLTETISEFGFSQSKAERKVRLNELIGSLQNTTSHGELKKQLRTVNKRSKVASVPLSKVEESKIQRTTAYEKTKEDLSKWNSVVAENRKAEQISFPLQQPNLKLQTTDEVKARFKPRTPLEMEIAALLQKNADTVGTHDAELTPAEERALKAMSLEEARERRAELQKYRALLTFKQARAKREKKIKSKKYHRILKKERLKKEKAEMEELQRTDPEKYIEKLEQLDRERVKERMTLKHRGGSKFALRQKIYGKYDDRSRDAVQSMLQTHKELTKKVVVPDDSDNNSESGVSLHSDDDDDDMIATQMTLTRGDNPWMKVKSATSEFHRPHVVKNTEAEMHEDVEEMESDEDEEEEEEEDSQEEEEDDMSNTSTRKSIPDQGQSKKRKPETQAGESDVSFSEKKRKRKRNKKKKKEEAEEDISEEDDSGKGDEDAIDSLFDALSQSRLETAKRLELKTKSEASKVTKKQSQKTNVKVKGQGSKRTKTGKSQSKKERDINGEDLEDEGLIDLSLNRKRTLEDMEGGFEQTGKGSKDFTSTSVKKSKETNRSKTEDVFVDPKKLFTLTTRLTNSADVDIITDEDGVVDADEQQRLTIAQAFEDDDVIDEFTKEKADILDRDKPKDIDLTLPGWGDWGGSGVKPSKKKKRRFILKAPDAAPRRDRDLGNVIISEKINNAISSHQVSRLPFPYISPDQFEQSIRAPIGKNWNPETAFKNLIKPKIVTKLGQVIHPINKSDVFKIKKERTESCDIAADGSKKQNRSDSRSKRKQKEK